MVGNAFEAEVSIWEDTGIWLEGDNGAVEFRGGNFFYRAFPLALAVFLNIGSPISMHLGFAVDRSGSDVGDTYNATWKLSGVSVSFR